MRAAALGESLPPGDPTVAVVADAPPTQPLLPGSTWHVRLLGALEARNGDVTLRHFVSRPVAALLARLSLQPQRQWAREELIEMLWPGVQIDVGRNRLRNAISSLRRLLEAPGSPAGSVLIADRRSLQLAPHTTRCDAVEFERCMRERRHEDALRWYAGELLPGFYDDWVQDERARLIHLHERLQAATIDGFAQPPGEPSSRPLPPSSPAPASASRSAASSPSSPAGSATEPSGPATAQSPPVETMPPEPVWRAVPLYLTGFFGREAERAAAADAVRDHRLVTLTGMGGAGKTRLAVEVAGMDGLAGRFELIAFVPLADCVSSAQGLARVRAALALSPSTDSLEVMVLALAGRRSLLILDNCEQMVADEVQQMVGTLLQRLPLLRLLVTSRRALGYPGERELLLAPLPRPDRSEGLQQVSRNPSVALFIDRARSVRPDFQITERNLETLAALCSALEGLPLALELAASRSRAYTPGEMLAALGQPFSLLARPGARASATPRRHDSLDAAIAWSWQLLQPREQRFLVALSVYRGGWTTRSAAAVCEEPDAARLLEELATHSLLRVTPADDAGSMRFDMLEMIRVFVADRLDPVRSGVLRHRHRLDVMRWASGEPADGSGGAGSAVGAVELPNAEEALRTAVADGDPASALRLGLLLRPHWERNGISPDALAVLETALASVSPAAHADWADACTMTALLSLSAGQGAAAVRLAEAAVVHSPPASLARAVALCARCCIALESRRQGADVLPMLEEAMSVVRQSGRVALEAQCLGLRCMVTLHLKGSSAQADADAQEARRLYRSIGADREASALLYERTMCLLQSGALGEALIQARQLEQESILLGDRLCQLKAINQQGVILATMRRWAEAIADYGRCVRLAWDMQNHYWLTFALWNHCRNLARLHDPERAALLMAFAQHHWTTHFAELADDDRRFVRQVRRLVRCQVGADRLDALWRAGAKLTMVQAVRLALRQQET